MKKIYFAPETNVVKIALQHIIATSPGSVTLRTSDAQVTDGNSIGSRRGGSLWDDDEDADY